MRPACRRRPSAVSRTPGARSTRSGASATSRRKRYVYFWVDGIYVEARLEDQAQCILVIIGANAGGQEGACRLHRRPPRERAILARAAARSQAPRSLGCARARRRRRCARLLEGARRGMADDARATLLGAQDR